MVNNSATNLLDFPRRMYALGAEFSAKVGDCWAMVRPQAGPVPEASDADAPEYHFDTSGEFQPTRGQEGIPLDIGHKWRLMPALGEIVWKLPQTIAASVPFRAYLCRLGDGRQIGYVRVPHYAHDEHTAHAFGDLIARFEDMTAAMVFDQMDNPGGSMFHMYAILSTLTDRALPLPTHQITIGDDEAAVAADVVATAEAGEEVPPDERPSPELVTYSRFVLSEKAAGRGTGKNLTNPVYLGGVAEVLPAKIHYTKKIVVLINELTFSAGEFLAAILQDNKRATLFGERTAGAGGCTKRFYHNGPVLHYSYTLTWTIARRTNGQYIENIGVHPDVRYSITREDIMSGYAGYQRALLACLAELLLLK